jgi:hypothetical protein
MKALTKPLFDFITDFQLVKKDNIICFDAIIYFSTNISSVQLPTEVQIITIGKKELNVVYLLNPDVNVHKIPDMYREDIESFNYFKNRALIIKGHMPSYGEYVLSIHPGDNACDENTLKEIHAKMYN